MTRNAFVARLLATTALLSVGVAVFLTGAAAQTARGRSDESAGAFRVQQWELRGVVIADPGPKAIVEYRPSGRQQLLRVGDILVGGVAVAAITADRVVLKSEGRAITLRLGHGGRARVSRPRMPVRLAWPPSMLSRRQSR